MSYKALEINPPTPNKRAQQAAVIGRALVARKPVNAVDAGTQYGIWRLSAIVHRLRRKGWPIISLRDANNGMARYYLPPHWIPNPHDDPAR